MGGGKEEERGGVTNSFTKSSSGVWRSEDNIQEEAEKKVWPSSSADQRRHKEQHGRPGGTDQRPEPESSPGSASQHLAQSTAGECAESWQQESILRLRQHSASRRGTGGAQAEKQLELRTWSGWRERRGSLVVEHQAGTAAPLRLTNCQVPEAPVTSGKESTK